tara:strand:- start:88100 stop:89545 length:1446 start_codon:yes stop_codon:yes gene_type:complete
MAFTAITTTARTDASSTESYSRILADCGLDKKELELFFSEPIAVPLEEPKVLEKAEVKTAKQREGEERLREAAEKGKPYIENMRKAKKTGVAKAYRRDLSAEGFKSKVANPIISRELEELQEQHPNANFEQEVLVNDFEKTVIRIFDSNSSNTVVQELTIVWADYLPNIIGLLKKYSYYSTLSLAGFAFTNEQVIELIDSATKVGGIEVLTDIDLSGCTQVTKDLLPELIKKCPAIQLIKVRGCPQIEELNALELAKAINFNWKQEDASLAFIDIIQRVSHYRQLNLAGCKLSSRAMSNLMTCCSSHGGFRYLEALDMSGCAALDVNVIGGSFGRIFHGTCLKELTLKNCSWVKEAEERALRHIFGDACSFIISEKGSFLKKKARVVSRFSKLSRNESLKKLSEAVNRMLPRTDSLKKLGSTSSSNSRTNTPRGTTSSSMSGNASLSSSTGPSTATSPNRSLVTTPRGPRNIRSRSISKNG